VHCERGGNADYFAFPELKLMLKAINMPQYGTLLRRTLGCRQSPAAGGLMM
jgi:hypothetical protein